MRSSRRHDIRSRSRQAEAKDFAGFEPFAWQAVVVFALFAAINLVAKRLADLTEVEYSQAFVLPEALQANLSVLVLIAFALAALAQFGRGSLLVSWDRLDRGREIQALAGILIFFLTWRQLSADYDFLSQQWHLADRVFLVVAAVLSIYRPVFLLLFIIEMRVLEAPIGSSFDFAHSLTPDELPVLTLIAICAVVLLAAACGHTKTDTLVPLLSAAIAVQFFDPGLTRLDLDWFIDDDLANLPLNGFQQGWLGGYTEGRPAQFLADVLDRGREPFVALVAAVQVGAILFVLRRRLLMAALVAWIGFHVVVMGVLGFSYLEWVIVELGFFLLLADPIGQRWSLSAFRLLPLIITTGAILAGAALLDSTERVWFDGPVTYTYEFDGIDEEGNERILVANDFAPHDAVFTFGALDLGPSMPVAAGYGALSRSRFDLLPTVGSMADLVAIEESLEPTTLADEPVDRLISEGRRERSVEAITQFLLATDREHHYLDYLPNPLHRYWTSRLGQNYVDRVPLTELRVTRVTRLRIGDEVEERRELVATFVRSGEAVDVIWAAPG